MGIKGGEGERKSAISHGPINFQGLAEAAIAAIASSQQAISTEIAISGYKEPVPASFFRLCRPTLMDLSARLSAVSPPSSHVLALVASLQRTIKNLERHIIDQYNLYDLCKLFTLLDSLQLPFPVSQRVKKGFAFTQSMLGPCFRPFAVVDRLSDIQRKFTIEIIDDRKKGKLTVRHTIEISSESLWLRTLYVLRSFAV